ncbi:hypothetical protein SK128_000016 [Halocaridina rubra]|uniref:Uncharacterized protein n=1 Tax=Halocaridina rubra TaxID=373956 RepID=A0AAN8WNS5_HALRR
MLSILFVVVVVAVVFFMVRPWAGSCKYPRSKSKSRLRDSIIPSGDSREFANSSFQDRSHQMRLQERISTRDTAA